MKTVLVLFAACLAMLFPLQPPAPSDLHIKVKEPWIGEYITNAINKALIPYSITELIALDFSVRPEDAYCGDIVHTTFSLTETITGFIDVKIPFSP
jgi:hypothetical protein